MRATRLTTILFLFFFINLFFNSTYAQNTGKRVVKGSITDSKGNPVNNVLISLISMPDSSLLTQTTAQADGHFILSTLHKGLLSYKLSKLGLRTVYGPGFSLTKDTLKLQPIVMEAMTQELSEVTIQASATSLLQAKGNKLVYNVAGSINVQGTTAFEVIRKTPGVIIERDNSIGINGRKGVLVLINEKPSYLQGEELISYLKSLPSSSIRSIEVMNNTSAQYDAAGSGGVLNIKLNKSLKDGFNMILNNGVSYGLTLKQNTELSFNSRQGKLNVFGLYNHAFGNNAYRYGMTRIQDDKIFESPTKDTDFRKTINGMIGADYEINDKQTIGLALNTNTIFGPGITDTKTTIKDQNTNELLSTLIAQNDYYQQNANRYNTNLNYRFQDSTGTTFSVDADYGYFDGGSKNLQPNSYYDPSGSLTSTDTYRSLNNRNIRLYALATDYQQKLWTGKMDIGLKYSGISADNGFLISSLKNGNETTDPKRSNQFDYTEKVAAAYVQYQLPLSKKLKLEAGFRLEHTNSLGELMPLAASEIAAQQIKRNYLNLFPSASLSLQLAGSNALALSYGKRIDRPSYQSLNPFEYLLDELSFWKGNPFLQPQITHKADLQYSVAKTIINFSFSLTNDYAAQITDTLDVNKVVMTPRNLGKQYNTALTVIQQVSILKGWDLSLTATGYHLRNKVSFGQYRDFNLSRFAGSLNAQQTFQLPLALKAELSAIYQTKRLGGSNETMKNSSQIDVGFQRNFFSNKASLRLALTDIFLGNNWDSKSRMNGLYLDSYGHAESRQVKLNFSVNLGRSGIKGPSQRDSGLKNETQRL